MIIKLIPVNLADVILHKLPEPDMVVDPRPSVSGPYWCKFNVSVKGTSLRITRSEQENFDYPGWDYNFLPFLVYQRNEFHYSFESTKYLYHGLNYERIPEDATEVIVKDGIKIIRRMAFYLCSSLSKITIPNSVTIIGSSAFWGCTSLRFVQLPPNLESIANDAFYDCPSLEAIYIPPTVKHIGDEAFAKCTSMRIINIPENAKLVNYDITRECDGILTDEITSITGNREYQFLLWDRYNGLHNLCWDPSVKADSIQQYIQEHNDNEERATTNDKPQFTPLHLLAANPSVNGELITAYLQLAPDVAVMQDNIGETPLHMLCSVSCFTDALGCTIRAYLATEGGRRAAFVKDHEGKTPFDRLCEKEVHDIPFLMNKSFGGLMMFWWYDCLGLDFSVEH